MMTHAAHGIAYAGNCVLSVNINPAGRKAEALKISDVVVKKSEDDMLSSLSLGSLLCVGYPKLLKNGHRDCRES